MIKAQTKFGIGKGKIELLPTFELAPHASGANITTLHHFLVPGGALIWIRKPM